MGSIRYVFVPISIAIANYTSSFDFSASTRSASISATTPSSSNIPGAVSTTSIVLTPLSPDKASTEGQWKKKKGPAPPRPIPPKRQVKKIPRKAVNQELKDIESKQIELEGQGVILEEQIRELMVKSDAERTEAGLEISNDRDSLGLEVEDGLEMDRLRALEEDESIETHVEEYAAIKPSE